MAAPYNPVPNRRIEIDDNTMNINLHNHKIEVMSGHPGEGMRPVSTQLHIRIDRGEWLPTYVYRSLLETREFLELATDSNEVLLAFEMLIEKIETPDAKS
jgi:hypothetical protein